LRLKAICRPVIVTPVMRWAWSDDDVEFGHPADVRGGDVAMDWYLEQIAPNLRAKWATCSTRTAGLLMAG
jgi:hypothetical protein